MKRIKEIRLENFSDIEKVFDDVKSFAKAKNTDVYKDVLLVGEETIRKFEDVYGISFPSHRWEWADERYKNLKIEGSAKFVYVGRIVLVSDFRNIDKNGCKSIICAEGIDKVVEYKDVLLWSGCSYNDRTYRFYLYNEAQDTNNVETEYPKCVGTLTDKKADAWLDCLLDEKERSIEKDNANVEKVKQFKNKLADLTKRPLDDFSGNSDTLKMGMFKIYWSCDVNTGNTSLAIDFDVCAKGKNGKFLTAFDRIKILNDVGLLKY